MKTLLRLPLLLLIFAFLLPSAPGTAQSGQDGLSMLVQAGFEGYYKTQTWIPVTIWLENTGAPIDGVLEVRLDDYIQPDVVYRYPIELPTTSRKEIHLSLYPEVNARAVQVKLLEGKQVLGQAEDGLIYLDNGNPLFGVLSASASNFSLLAELDLLGELTGSASVAVLDGATFPTRSQALEALNVIVLCNLESTGAAALTPEQVQALQSWTAAGGRLLLAGGPSWRTTFAGLENSGLLPVIPSGERVITEFSDLNAFFHQEWVSALPFVDGRAGVVVSVGAAQPGAAVLVRSAPNQGFAPLVAQMDYGSGRVTYLAFDPTLEPFASWADLPLFYRQLLETPLNKPEWLGGFRDWYSARTATQVLPGVHLPSAWLIVGTLALYVLVLGPVNFVLLRLIKRRDLGWITLPATVVAVTILVFVAGGVLRAGGAIVGRITIMQIWPGIETGRAYSLVSLYSPSLTSYEVELRAPGMIHRLPVDPPEPRQNLVITQEAEWMRLSNLRLDSGSLAPFAVETVAPAPDLEINSELVAENNQVVLQGRVTNRSTLNLETVVVHTPGGIEELGPLGPGQYAEFNVPFNSHVLVHDPANPLPAFTNPSPYGYYGPETILVGILGTTDYYQDPEAYWRYQALFASLGGYEYTSPNLGGLFLTAWGDSAPYELTLPGKRYRNHDATLYVVALSPEMKLAAGSLTLDSGFFSRRVIENPMGSGIPVYLYSGQRLVFEDTPIVPLTYTHLSSLSVNLSSSMVSGAIQDFSLSLWDYSTGEWILQQNLMWGTNLITEPERFVSDLGAVRVEVEGTSAQGVQIDNIEIGMVLER